MIKLNLKTTISLITKLLFFYANLYWVNINVGLFKCPWFKYWPHCVFEFDSPARSKATPSSNPGWTTAKCSRAPATVVVVVMLLWWLTCLSTIVFVSIAASVSHVHTAAFLKQWPYHHIYCHPGDISRNYICTNSSPDVCIAIVSCLNQPHGRLSCWMRVRGS